MSNCSQGLNQYQYSNLNNLKWVKLRDENVLKVILVMVAISKVTLKKNHTPEMDNEVKYIPQ